MNTSDTMQQFTVTVRLLKEEMEILKQKASEANLSKSAFVRNAIRYGGAYPKTNFSTADRKALQRELDRMGNNLNTISFCAHGNGNRLIYPSDLDRLHYDFAEILSSFFQVIHGAPK